MRLFVSLLDVPDGKVHSLEAAVLANYLTTAYWQSYKRLLKEILSLPSEIMKARNNFSEIFDLLRKWFSWTHGWEDEIF